MPDVAGENWGMYLIELLAQGSSASCPLSSFLRLSPALSLHSLGIPERSGYGLQKWQNGSSGGRRQKAAGQTFADHSLAVADH